MSEEKTFFVGIENPISRRKDILECSKDIVGILKTYDSVNDIRKEKIEKVSELKRLMTEIRRLNNILKNHLPTDKIRTSEPVKRTKPKNSNNPKKIPSKKPDKNIKKLESELSDIESKLNSMGV
jgi:hypothetical protein